MIPRRLIFALCLCLPAFMLPAQVPAPGPADPTPNPLPPPAPPEAYKEVAPGVLQFGLVTVEPKQRLIKLAAKVNFREGPIDCALVGQQGKTHGCLLVTSALTSQLHRAMLFLGFKEAPALAPATPQPEILTAGTPVRITVHWLQDGKPKEVPLENWIVNGKTQEPMAAGDWIYNGTKGGNSAPNSDQEHSFISLAPDSPALIHSPTSDPSPQALWKARSDEIPEIGTPIEIQIQWPEPPSASLPPPPSEPLAPLPSSSPSAPAPASAPPPAP